MQNYRKKINQMKFSTYFKYISEDIQVIESLFKDRKIRFTQPAALNDPLEVHPKIIFNDLEYAYKRYTYKGKLLPSYRDWVYLQLIERIYNKYGIVSLTKKPFNYDMWNLYASGHRGLLIEYKEDFFKYKGFNSQNRNTNPKRVKYVQVPQIKYSIFENNNGETNDYEIIDLLYYIKSVNWRKEVEYRCVRPIHESDNYILKNRSKSYRDYFIYLFEYDIKSIHSITFGALTKPGTKEQVIGWLKDTDIEFNQAVIMQGDTIKIFIESVKKWKTIDSFLKMAPQVFVSEEELFLKKYNSKQDLKYLEEMPFYEYIKENLEKMQETGDKRFDE